MSKGRRYIGSQTGWECECSQTFSRQREFDRHRCELKKTKTIDGAGIDTRPGLGPLLQLRGHLGNVVGGNHHTPSDSNSSANDSFLAHYLCRDEHSTEETESDSNNNNSDGGPVKGQGHASPKNKSCDAQDGATEAGVPASPPSEGAKSDKQETGDDQEARVGKGCAASLPALAVDDRRTKRPADCLSVGGGGSSSTGRPKDGVRSSASSSSSRAMEKPRSTKKSRQEAGLSNDDEWRVGGQGACRGLDGGLDVTPSPLSGRRVEGGREGGGCLRVQRTPTCVSGTKPSRKQTIYPHMDVVTKWDKLKTVLTKEELPAIVGLMMAEAPLEVLRDVLKGQTDPSAAQGKKEAHAKKGASAERGFVSSAMTVFSHALVGEQKLRYSGSKVPTAKNNAFFAAALQLWPSDPSPNVEATFIKSLSSTRSEMHCDIRKGLVELATAALRQAAALHCAPNGDATLDVSVVYSETEDVAKELLTDAKVVETFMETVFSRSVKAHRAKDRKDLTLGDIFGETLLVQDFKSQVAAPLLHWALADMEYSKVPPIPGESSLDEAVRRAESWGKLQLGGFTGATARKFQARMWDAMFSFCTGKRRHAHPLLHLKPGDFDKMKGSMYIRPYLRNDGC